MAFILTSLFLEVMKTGNLLILQAAATQKKEIQH